MKFLEEHKQDLFVIKQLVTSEKKRKYARSNLGIIWSVLNPLLTMAIMSMIFSYMFRKSIENFPIYMLTGNIIWGLFNGSTNSAMSALVSNKSLLSKVMMPKQVFVLSSIGSALLNFFYNCIAYLLMLIVFQIEPSWTMLLFPIPIIFALIFSTGVGYFLSIAYVYFADIKYLYSVFLTLLHYLCAIFYPISSLPVQVQQIIRINPIFVFIDFARSVMLYQTVPGITMWIKMIVWSVGVFAFGYWFFKRNENNVMQKI